MSGKFWASCFNFIIKIIVDNNLANFKNNIVAPQILDFLSALYAS